MALDNLDFDAGSGSGSAGVYVLARRLIDEVPHLRRRAMPGFEDSARRIVKVWGPQEGQAGELSRLLRDMGRFALGNWAIYLEATPGGLTLSRMQQALAGSGISGLGRARAILAYLIFIRYVERAEPIGDTRVRPYRTTERLRGAFRARLRRELEVRQDLDPDIPRLLAAFDDEAVYIRFFILISEVTHAMTQIAEPHENEIDLFSERMSGLIILCELLQAGAPGDRFPPRGPVAISVTDLARRCDTSRTQVNQLLRQARAAGYLIPTEDGGERFSEALLANFESLVAGTTDLVIACARNTMGGPLSFD